MPFRFRQQTYLFTFRIGFFSLCLFFFCLFFVLGMWQLHRYHYKKTLLATYQSRLTAAPQSFLELTNSPIENLQFKIIKTTGYYINNQTMLLQNQFYQDQIGFDVLTPFRLVGEKKLLLVDRGWIAQPKNKILPTITNTISKKQTITGYIKLLNEYQFTLGENILNPSASPIVMQKIDIKKLNQITHQDFYPFILRLNPAAPLGFVREWPIATSLPERHMAYAVQWFAMALVLLIAYLCFCCERVIKKGTSDEK